ncbi:NUDIX hydrolase [Glutamicibacter protophormiae]|uniref:NUDIX hydrolase n=1 Tax=Glutamicibacter protophormiae TaxID=37930 RepID=UPI00195C81E2|nr:NUDIX hydrolase [Glutamicibacter protophormiae]
MVRRLFDVPLHEVSAAENWFAFGTRTPRAARKASSVTLVRDTSQGVETYLTYRPGGSPLGNVAFPGGSHEASDRAAYQWFGPSLSQWSKRMDVLDQQLVQAHIVCAIRELFEETGILLAGTDEQSVIEMTDPEEWMTARESIAGQDLGFDEFLRRRGLGLRTDLLRPVAHWLSPNFAFRRFDTWYFAATVPLRQEPTLLRGKGKWGRWCVASQVIAKRNSSALGDMVGQPNTVDMNLSQITYPAVEIMLERMTDANGVVAYLSRVRSFDLQHPDLLVRDGTYYLEVIGTQKADSARSWQATAGH